LIKAFLISHRSICAKFTAKANCSLAELFRILHDAAKHFVGWFESGEWLTGALRDFYR
jgi:hypothetical protein